MVPPVASSAPHATLRLSNRSGRLARANFDCGGHPLWAVWLPAEGEVVLPAFPPPAGFALEACFVDGNTQVAYTSRLVSGSSACCVLASFSTKAGAHIFDVSAKGEPAARSLDLVSSVPWPVTFTMGFQASPYALRTVVRPGGRRVFRYTGLELTVVQDGLSTACLLPADVPPGDSGWEIVPAQPPALGRVAAWTGPLIQRVVSAGMGA